MSNEPKWPALIDVIQGASCGMPDGDGCYSKQAVNRAIEMCRAAWLAANDDPTADLTGTVRIQPDTEVRWIKLGGVGGAGVDYWRDITGTESTRLNDEVVGWTRGTPVEGTPAAKQLLAESVVKQAAEYNEAAARAAEL